MSIISRYSADGKPAQPASADHWHTDETLVIAVRTLLQESRFPPLRRVLVDCNLGVITLQGVVPTYYLKQMAQTVACQMAGVRQVMNELEVV